MPDSPVSEPVDLDSATAAAEAGLDTFLLGLDEHPYAVYTDEGLDIWRRGVAQEMLKRAGVPAMLARIKELEHVESQRALLDQMLSDARTATNEQWHRACSAEARIKELKAENERLRASRDHWVEQAGLAEGGRQAHKDAVADLRRRDELAQAVAEAAATLSALVGQKVWPPHDRAAHERHWQSTMRAKGEVDRAAAAYREATDD